MLQRNIWRTMARNNGSFYEQLVVEKEVSTNIVVVAVELGEQAPMESLCWEL